MTLHKDMDAIFRPGSPAVNPSDSIRARIDTKGARNESSAAWTPVPLSQLGEGDAVDWAWNGYLARGHITLFTGLWKSGETTLVAYLLREFGSGGELAGAVNPTRVVVVSEESRGLWVRRRDEIGIGDHVHVVCRPFKTRPALGEWRVMLDDIATYISAHGVGVVIFDTLSTLWPTSDENDATKVTDALLPLHALTEVGAAVLLVHHPRKSDAGEGRAARGSGALPGFVDVIIELRRFQAENREDRRRVLTGYSRFDETPSEVVVELSDEGYRMVGTKRDASQADRMAVIGELLPSEGDGATAAELHTAWPDADVARPGKRTIQIDLRKGAAEGRWVESGIGARGSPYRYRLADSIRAGSDSQRGQPKTLGTGGVDPIAWAKK